MPNDTRALRETDDERLIAVVNPQSRSRAAATDMFQGADEILESKWMPLGYVYIIDAKRCLALADASVSDA